MSKISGKVWIISSKKIDGRYNVGYIVGYSSTYGYLGARSFSDYKSKLGVQDYQVAYQDVVTKRCCLEWFHVSDLSKSKPEDISNE